MTTNKKVSDEKENLTMAMKFINEEIEMKFVFEKSAKYKSIEDLELIESRPFETRFPGCQLRWRARYFRDTFQDPPEHSVSLQLLSCQIDSGPAVCPELTTITARCYLEPVYWLNSLVNVTVHLHNGQKLINRNAKLESDKTEQRLLDFISNRFVKLEVRVLARFQPQDLVFSYKRGDFTTLPPLLLVQKDDEKVSFHESFRLFDDITVTAYKFEKFANYESSEALSLLQSEEFVTPFPDCQLTWRVRYFRDIFQKPYQHSICLQLLKCVLDEKQQTQVHVTSQLRIGNDSKQSVLAAEFKLLKGEKVPITKSDKLHSDTIEELLTKVKGKLRVGLVVYVSAYSRRIKPTDDSYSSKVLEFRKPRRQPFRYNSQK